MRSVLALTTLTLGLSFAGARASDTDEAATVAACARAHRLVQAVDLSGGVYTERAVAAAPLSVSIPAGIDNSGFAACLGQHGAGRGLGTAGG
jgi:uncharacterized membrane protein